MKKEKSKDQAAAEEIRLRFEPGKMVFAIGNQEFYLTEETAGSIFGRPLGIEFERLSGKDDDFGGLRSLPNFVRVARLLSKGLGLPQIARVLGVPEERLRRFYSNETSRPRVESWNPNEIATERQRQAELEMDFIHEAPRVQELGSQAPPTPNEIFVNLLEVRNLRREGLSDQGIAGRLHLDPGEFFRFIELNRRYLDLIP